MTLELFTLPCAESVSDHLWAPPFPVCNSWVASTRHPSDQQGNWETWRDCSQIPGGKRQHPGLKPAPKRSKARDRVAGASPKHRIGRDLGEGFRVGTAQPSGCPATARKARRPAGGTQVRAGGGTGDSRPARALSAGECGRLPGHHAGAISLRPHRRPGDVPPADHAAFSAGKVREPRGKCHAGGTRVPPTRGTRVPQEPSLFAALKA